jgi:hypothetical protein
VSPQVSARQCVPEAFCATGTEICTAKRTAGQSCTQSYYECAGLLQCHGGICGGLGALNAPCDTSRPCKYGLKCGTTNVCVNTGAIGAPCTGFYGDCEPHLTCDVPAGQTMGTCSRIHTLGESCTYGHYQCGFAGALYCTATSVSPTGICAMKKGVGASCSSYDECATSNCASNVCAGCVDPTP